MNTSNISVRSYQDPRAWNECRHCGSPAHMSIDCDLLYEDEPEPDMHERIFNEVVDRQIEQIKAKTRAMRLKRKQLLGVSQ